MRSATLVEALAADPVGALDLLTAAAPEVAAMAGCPQPTNHHAEGGVLAHSRLALTALLDLGCSTCRRDRVWGRCSSGWSAGGLSGAAARAAVAAEREMLRTAEPAHLRAHGPPP